ncbi:MAG TPA: hypothetical protein VHW23_35425 [Kofleriaceae bacterium]|jgi:hypothetical protein|nr:hypothetical protein [Kofleriaceae bacterium]
MQLKKLSWNFGSLLGLALAVLLAIVSRPVAAGDKLGTGMKCSGDSECESGYCSSNKCQGKNGNNKLGTGMECKGDSECESGYCSSNKCQGKS